MTAPHDPDAGRQSRDDMPDLQALAHHDAPRTWSAKESDILQRQIDALRSMYDAMLTHARTVTHQIADLTLRAQRTDADLAASNTAIRSLTGRVEEHMVSSDKRDADLDNRIADITRTQGDILKEVRAGSEVLQQIRDRNTAGRVLGSWLRGTSGIVLAIGAVGAALFAAVRFIASTPI